MTFRMWRKWEFPNVRNVRLHLSYFWLTCFFPFIDSCLKKLYILAFTSGVRHGGSDRSHGVKIILSGGRSRLLRLYDRPGNDMLSNKGDLWKINFSNFRFGDRCITLKEIKGAIIVAQSNDGWHIDSIVTFVGDSQGRVQVLTQNFNAFRWVDGNGHYSHRHFDLTMAWTQLNNNWLTHGQIIAFGV